MNKATAIQDQYDEDFQVCYGCGEKNTHGLRIKSFPDGDEVVALFMPRPEHLAVPGVVYGGLIASLIDCHGIATGAEYFRQREHLARPPRCVTGSLQVDYLKPTPMSGHELELRARVLEASARKAVVAVTLSHQHTITARGQVVAVKLPKDVKL